MLCLIGSAAAALTADQLVGVWQGQVSGAEGLMQIDLTLMRDGCYTEVAAGGDVTTRLWGRWRVIGQTVHLDIEGAEPLPRPSGETRSLQIVDPDTMVKTNGALYRVA